MRKILHIGTHKTATTSLQTALYDNRDSLAKQGVVYPDLQRWGLRQRAGHHTLAKALADDQDAGQALTRDVLETAEAEAGPDHTILISSEQYFRHTLAHSGKDDLATRRENFVRLMSETYGRDTEVVIVLRRPDSFCESRHQERVKKTPYTAKIADYAMDPEERIGFDYAFQIQLLQKHFDTVTVLIFEKLIQDKAAGGAEQAFMKALGLEVTFERPPQRLNESLHPYLVDYKRLMNYQRDEKKGTVREFKVLLELQRNGAFEWSGEKMTMWAEADRMAFLTSLDESLTWVAENFPNLCNEEGRLFPAVSNLPLHVPETPIAIFEEILGKVTARGQVRSNAARGKKTRKRKQRD